MPYLYEAARAAHAEGVPMMRAMVLEFPDDPGCTHLERQYMLGPDLLVAPVFSDDGDVAYYVPEGTWTHFLGGRTVTGPRWVRERHGFLSVPLLVRPGAVIPVGSTDDRPDYDFADGVTLRAYGLARGAQVTVPVGDVTFTVVREGDTLRASSSDPSAPWGLAAGGREVRARAGTGFLSLELEPSPELELSPELESE
jgi:alpha-D-xyloside xylohydrolase